MSEASDFLLDTCFWQPLDNRIPAEATDLLTGLHEGQRLIDILQLRFGLTATEAQFEIEAARQEVQL